MSEGVQVQGPEIIIKKDPPRPKGNPNWRKKAEEARRLQTTPPEILEEKAAEAKQETLEKNEDQEIKFFGEIDLNQYGRVGADYPAWTFPRQIESLKEEIGRMERELESGTILPQNVPNLKLLLKQSKDKLDKIESSRPKLNGKAVDRLAQFRKEIGEEIKSSMFSYDDMQRGLADAHEEARRMSEPIIRVPNMEIAKACNLRVDRTGKVSRDEAIRAWKIAGRALQEHGGWEEKTNAESMRRPR